MYGNNSFFKHFPSISVLTRFRTLIPSEYCLSKHLNWHPSLAYILPFARAAEKFTDSTQGTSWHLFCYQYASLESIVLLKLSR